MAFGRVVGFRVKEGLVVNVAGADVNPPPNGHPVLTFVVIVTLTGPGVVISDARIVVEEDVVLGVVVA